MLKSPDNKDIARIERLRPSKTRCFRCSYRGIKRDIWWCFVASDDIHLLKWEKHDINITFYSFSLLSYEYIEHNCMCNDRLAVLCLLVLVTNSIAQPDYLEDCTFLRKYQGIVKTWDEDTQNHLHISMHPCSLPDIENVPHRYTLWVPENGTSTGGVFWDPKPTHGI